MSRARELAKAGGTQQRIAGLSSHVGVSTFASDVYIYEDLVVSGDINVTGDMSFDEQTATNSKITGIGTINDLYVSQNLRVAGISTIPQVMASTVSATGVITATGGLDVGGNFDITGNIIPSADNTYDLGSSSKMWKDVYIGPGSLYVNGQKVIEEDSSNIIVSCDDNQNLVLQTSGSGDLELDPTGTGVIQVKGALQIENGQNITNSAGNNVTFGNRIGVDQIISKTDDTNLTLSGEGSGKVRVADDLEVTGSSSFTGGLTIGTNGVSVTTLSASGIATATGGFVGALTGNVTGNVTGDVTGDLTGDSAGTHTGDVTGDVTGDLTGDVTGNVTGNLTGDVTGDLTGDSAGTHTGAVVGDVTGSITDTGDSTIAYLNSTTVNVGAGLTVGGNAVVEGNLTVNGTTTTVNSTTMTVDDKNIELGSTASPSDAGANGGGITLKGDTDKTIAWDSTTGAWDLSEDVNVVSGKKFTIADTSVLTATTLGSGVVNSSLTSVGTLGSLGVTGTVTAGAFTGDLTGDVTGDVTGAVTGNVTGNLTGDVTGDVTGDLTGDVTGNVTGNLTGTVNTASQTNITSVGTLGSLAVTNNITVGGTVDGRDVASDGTKLDGIESGATADQSAAEILTAIKTVDGAGSGLDADTLDGVSSGSFLRSDTADTMTGNLTMTGNITPSANDTYNCGSSANRWANVYSNDLDLSNEGSANEVDGTWGSYLIQEGESDLFIINRRSGKKFRFVVEEV